MADLIPAELISLLEQRLREEPLRHALDRLSAGNWTCRTPAARPTPTGARPTTPRSITLEGRTPPCR